ncbi:hypothetical protein H4582DRAFT_2078612 [Lactarius indigo]|nr:hypothetical protein H4582DRAFT_2078612 [Lactarius indigo]
MPNTSKQMKKPTKPTKEVERKGPGIESSDSEDPDDSDYNFCLQSNCSDLSFDRVSIISGDLHVIARRGVPTDDEEGGSTENERDSIAPGDLDMVTQEGVAPRNEESDSMGQVSQSIELTDEQTDILQRHVAAFQAADPDSRSKIIQVSVDSIKKSWRQGVGFNRDGVEMVPTGAKTMPELDKMALEMSGSKRGSAAYFGCYKKSIKVISQRLDEHTWVKYRAEAKKWTEQQAPPRQQQRMFGKHGINTMRDFSESMYRQYGVRVAILAGYCNSDGEPAIMFHDINNELGGTSFKSRHKDWQRDPMVEDFSRWTAESFGVHASDDSEEEGKGKDATPIIKLVIDKNGYPMLPRWEAIEREGLMYRKYLIGRFMGETYKIAVGGGKGRIPWARLKETPGDFILSKYLPAGVTLTQYHHIRQEDVNALLKHWTQRQAAGEIPFRFKMRDVWGRQAQGNDEETPGDGNALTKEGADGNGQEDSAGGPSDVTPAAKGMEMVPRCVRSWDREIEIHLRTHPTLHPLTLALALALSHNATLQQEAQGRIKLPRHLPLIDQFPTQLPILVPPSVRKSATPL